MAPIEKRYYTGEMIQADLRAFEERYAMTSTDFYRAYSEGRDVGVSPFDSVVWADLFRALCRLGGASPAELQPAG